MPDFSTTNILISCTSVCIFFFSPSQQNMLNIFAMRDVLLASQDRLHVEGKKVSDAGHFYLYEAI